MNTPSRRKTQEQAGEEPLLGSYYRLKSFKKLVGSTKKKLLQKEEECDQNLDENAIYTTPIRSSRRISSRKNPVKEELGYLEPSADARNGKILVTPNPYIRDDIVEELLNDILLKYKDKIQIISFSKQQQPQVLLDETKGSGGEIEDLDAEFNSKLQISNSDSNTAAAKQPEDEDLKHQESTVCKFEDREFPEGAESDKPGSFSPQSTRKKYFICRNRPRKVIGGGGRGSGDTPAVQSVVDKYQVIAENEYWMVVEFPRNSALYRKHSCSRILTQKRILGNPVNFPAIQSIDEYKALHLELKRLLELSNYCYSPDLF